ncbi:two-component regulator propeller domain-containing protein [Tahibacter amnicola]|uniref:histidine kinase n=1 Tax=Tahibacter amnicola TaxID=2976241 RepID=A0ABY6BHB8_9GAMM|nr:two-component regulator propeller domain-containing protein [Tahibacter amnicola]UXI67257.1 ATP-binding protein [Tahibacter amnicola]
MNPYLRLFALLLLCLAWPTPSPAQTRPLDELNLRSWNVDQGLPHNSVLTIGQTRDGMLWVGTWGGLSRFDGAEFRTFNRSNTSAIGDDGVLAMAPTRTGGLWVGTHGGGLLRVEDNRIEGIVAVGTTINGHVGALWDDGSTLWIGSESGGVYRLDQDKVTPIRDENLTPNLSVYAIVSDLRRGLWIGTRDGVFQMPASGGPSRRFDLPEKHRDAIVYDLVAASTEVLWVATSHGVFRHDPEQGWRQYVDNVSYRLAIDPTGQLWVGTQADGLIRIAGESVQRMPRFPGVPDSFVASLFPDHANGVWAGTNGGLISLQALRFRNLSNLQGLSNNFVRSLLEAPDGTIWAATARGLNRIKAGKIDQPFAGTPLGAASLLSLAIEPDGTLWAGTYVDGVWVVRNGKPERPNLGDHRPQSVRSVLVARDGTVWVGTNDGPVHFDPVHQRVLPDPPGRFGNVMTLHEDRKGRIWIGTNESLSRLDGDQVTTFGAAQGFQGKAVFGIVESESGDLWVATDNGLGRHRDNHFHFVTPQQGLPLYTVLGVVRDTTAALWLTSNAGIYRVAESELHAALANPSHRLQGRLYNRDDGMLTNQCNGASNPTAQQVRSGELWFSTAAGIAIVDPRVADSVAPEPPTVVIDRATIDGHEVNPALTPQLEPGSHTIAVQFTAAALTQRGNIDYAYRVIGMDERWEHIGAEKSIRLANLAPGQYAVEVAARMGDGPLTRSPPRFSFTIAPHLWERRGFLPAVIAIAVLISFVAFSLRNASLRRHNRLLEEQVSERTRELREANERQTKANEQLFQMNSQLNSEISDRLLAERTLHQRNEELASLNEKLAGAQSQLLQSDKMASVGQLAGGVAHEINTPIGFVGANLTSLRNYTQELFGIIDAYQRVEARIADDSPAWTALRNLKRSVDLEFLRQDCGDLLRESQEGIGRVAKIVRDLKDFSHVDEAEWQLVDLHSGLDTALNLLAHELKHRATIIKEYGRLPLVECLPFQVNQVFLALLRNAMQAIDNQGTITIRTRAEPDFVTVEVADTGKGIPEAHLHRIFEPFFTTRPVGFGTGLGLSVAYSIVQTHGGTISVTSEEGVGSTFVVRLPLVANRLLGGVIIPDTREST